MNRFLSAFLLPLAALLAALTPAAALAGDLRYVIDRSASHVDAKVAFLGIASKTAKFPDMSGTFNLSFADLDRPARIAERDPRGHAHDLAVPQHGIDAAPRRAGQQAVKLGIEMLAHIAEGIDFPDLAVLGAGRAQGFAVILAQRLDPQIPCLQRHVELRDAHRRVLPVSGWRKGRLAIGIVT